jgi:hypothetical protein
MGFSDYYDGGYAGGYFGDLHELDGTCMDLSNSDHVCFEFTNSTSLEELEAEIAEGESETLFV